MNKEKHIEEMAKDFCAVGIPCEECHLYKNRCHAKKYATRAYNAGYRKASEVTEEIFAEIDRLLEIDENDFDKVFEESKTESDNVVARALTNYVYGIRKMFAELKKKYTESER